ncbi:MAG: carboxypeptidase regulatory-like domain-containing protein [Acidobacteria bacterium]|nr:carboxypeptidase regulatory-like domain-containing protein [Acidobacteriota bacterium]
MIRLALALAVALTVSSPAQETTGSITGRVIDSTGAVIAGVEVVATQSETGTSRSTRSTASGGYSFPNLPIGPYTIAASHPGFKRATEKGLVLHVSEHLGYDITLQVGDVTQEVVVTADSDQVQTQSAEQGGIISGDQVRDLQLNGRSFFTLLELIPGVNSNLSDRTDPNSTPDLSINGARNSASNFSIDGGNNADVIVGSGSMNTFTSIETIAEFNVVTTPFSAEYGRGGFSQINVVTRGGKKTFHGGLFYFLRNDAFDAKDYFSHQTLPLKLNNFGFNVGGPVMLPFYNRNRTRTFFFFAMEWNRIVTKGDAVNTTVPGVAERGGDFSGLGPGRDGIFGTTDDPVVDPLTLEGFPGGKIPASRIDPNAAKLLTLYPLPNFVGPGAINFTSAAASRQNWRSEMLRIDHNISPTFRLYGRYTQDGLRLWNPYGGTALSSVTTQFPGLAVTDGIRPGRNAVVNGTQMIRPTFLQQFQFTFGRRITDFRSASQNADRKALGVTWPELFPENDGNVIPGITLGSGYASLSPYHVAHKELFTLELSDAFSVIRNRHNIKFGVYYSYGGNLEQPSNVNTGGTFSFTTNFSKNPIANLLLGYPQSYTEVEKPVVSDVRFGALEAYVLDEVKVRPNLTVNYGMRYTSYYNPYDLYGVATNFIPSLYDPAKAPQLVRSSGLLVPGTGDRLNGIVIAGQNSPYGRGIDNDLHGLWAPRFGFAYAPSKKMSFRGGYGLYYTRPLIGAFINNAFNNPPFSRTVTITQPSYTLLGGTQAASSPPALTTMGLPLKAPTVHQFSFGIQRELRKGQILNIAYVANHGVRLMRPININDAEPGTVTTGTNINFIRPYHGYGSITERQSSGSSIFHSLQVGYTARMGRKLNGSIAYTWGKSIDDGSSDRDAGDVPPNKGNSRAERARSNFDRKHIFTSSIIYQLPAPIPSPFFRGWKLSGILRLWSGRPFDVVMSSDVAQIGAVQNQRPDVIADAKGPRTVEEWFNRSAFARPRTGTFGNMGRNSLTGPGVNKWDLSLFKIFQVAEGKRLEFRGEFFNAFNHPSYSSVGTSLNVTATAVNPLLNSFAVITNTRDARVAQVALKIYF